MTVAQEAQHNGEFLKWLCPSSYWRVEDFLSSFRKERSEGTLEWALKLSEFREWRLSDLQSTSERRITWIKGPLGLGKSIMAAYFIDLLKTHYRNAVTAYFFCRSNEPGLTTARDILRTLAYQCARDNKDARKALEKLKSEGFQITADLGIRYLFEKLLLKPLQSVQEIYVVLDGLDEADDLTLDRTDPAGRPDLEVLLECLASIPSLRLLCISRPSAKIQAIIPNAFVRTISKNDNADDIEMYVLTEVEKSRTLKLLFNQDPVQYFREHGEGVFLWVKLVLQQLSKAKTASAFQKYLKSFSAASEVTDKLENLYRTILSRISRDDKEWVIEIIRWVLVAKVPLSIDTLQALVEWCQNDTMVSFSDFLYETCGSLLQILPRREGQDNLVQIVHETFKSFIVDPKVCPSSFVIHKSEAECHAAMQCLKCLTNYADAPKQVCKYSSLQWVRHLSKATAKTNLLVALHRFFTSNAVKFWIKRCCESEFDFDFATSADLPLEGIRRWLRGCTLSSMDDCTAGETDLEIEDVLNWQRDCLDNSLVLVETIGKAAVTLWLHESFDQAHAAMNCFILGLKYYWRRANRTRSNLDELDELTATKFQNLSVWADPTGLSVPVVHGNLGLAFYAVLEFDKCVQHLRGEKSIYDLDKQLLPYVAASLFASREYITIIETFDSRICDASMYVAKAYKIKEAHDKAIDVFQAAHERDPLSLVTWTSLFDAYGERGEVDKMIEMAKSAVVDKFRTDRATEWYLYEACRQKSNYEVAIHTYQESMDENPLSRTFLARIYSETGDYDRAIDLLESGLSDNPKHFLLSWDLIRAVINKGDYSEATQRLLRAMEKGYMSRETAVAGLVRVCQKLSDQRGLNVDIEQVAQRYRFDTDVVHHVCEAYIQAGEYEETINLSMSILTRDDLGERSFYRESLFGNLCKACKAKGDHTAAIELFESKAKIPNFHHTFALSSVLDLYDINHSSPESKKVFESIVGAADNVGVWAWPGLLRVSAGDRDFDAIVERMERLIDGGQMEASEDIAHELMNAYTTRGDNSNAVAKLTKIAHRLPLLPWPWHILGEMYRRMGNFEEAINVYESNFRNLPFDYSSYHRLATLYLSTCNYLQVIECYEVLHEMIGPGICDNPPPKACTIYE
jgi:pentatricopeptide repeat protein